MLRFEQVSKRYEGGHEALRDLTFHLPKRSLAFLTGHSGAGKSTLLKLIMRMERPSQGRVLVGGIDLDRLPRRSIPFYRRNIGVVFQNHRLLFDRSLFDNVALPLVIAGASRHEIGRRVRAALDKVGLLDKERMNPIQLSGGEQQRAGIARAVVSRPPLLLADEPTGNLDPDLSAEIMALFSAFSQAGVTVLIASHDTALIDAMDKPVFELHEGRLINDPFADSDAVPP